MAPNRVKPVPPKLICSSNVVIASRLAASGRSTCVPGRLPSRVSTESRMSPVTVTRGSIAAVASGWTSPLAGSATNASK